MDKEELYDEIAQVFRSLLSNMNIVRNDRYKVNSMDADMNMQRDYEKLLKLLDMLSIKESMLIRISNPEGGYIRAVNLKAFVKQKFRQLTEEHEKWLHGS